jgi:hypothetical protein
VGPQQARGIDRSFAYAHNTAQAFPLYAIYIPDLTRDTRRHELFPYLLGKFQRSLPGSRLVHHIASPCNRLHDRTPLLYGLGGTFDSTTKQDQSLELER